MSNPEIIYFLLNPKEKILPKFDRAWFRYIQTLPLGIEVSSFKEELSFWVLQNRPLQQTAQKDQLTKINVLLIHPYALTEQLPSPPRLAQPALRDAAGIRQSKLAFDSVLQRKQSKQLPESVHLVRVVTL